MYERLNGITFFSSRPHHEHEAFARSIGADFYLFKFDGKTKKPLVELVRAPFARKPRSDIYVCESPLYLFTVIPQKLLRPRLKVVLMASSPFRIYYERSGITGRALFRWALSRVDGVIAVSGYVADYYKNIINRPVKVAYPYADVGHFDGDHADRSSNNVVFLGKMMPYKGVDILIEAFRLIRREKPDAKLYVMGHFKDGSYDLPEVEGMEVVGKVEDPLEYFSKACIYMHPAREEAFGISVIEACAAGLIPIVSSHTGAAEAIRPVCPELVVGSLDPADYCKKALEVMGWSVEKKNAVSASLREVARGFGKEESIRAFQRSFDDLMEELYDEK
jgi:glycosyltransferase involved in cell wall biosynthesis